MYWLFLICLNVKCNCLSHYVVTSDVNLQRRLDCILRTFSGGKVDYFFVLANNMHFFGGFSVFRWTPLSNNVFNDLSLNNEKHGLED